MARTTKNTMPANEATATENETVAPATIKAEAPAADAPAKKPRRKRVKTAKTAKTARKSKKSAETKKSTETKKEAEPKKASNATSAAEESGKSPVATTTNAVNPLSLDPAMWATHQTHSFAVRQLEAMFKFTEDRLIALQRDCFQITDGDVIAKNVELILGKKPIKIKKIRDPLRPKRPPTAYQLFCKNHRESSESKPSDLSELSRENSRRWHSLSEEERAQFKEKAEKAKEEWRVQVEEYDNMRSKVITDIIA